MRFGDCARGPAVGNNKNTCNLELENIRTSSNIRRSVATATTHCCDSARCTVEGYITCAHRLDALWDVRAEHYGNNIRTPVRGSFFLSLSVCLAVAKPMQRPRTATVPLYLHRVSAGSVGFLFPFFIFFSPTRTALPIRYVVQQTAAIRTRESVLTRGSRKVDNHYVNTYLHRVRLHACLYILLSRRFHFVTKQ